MGIRADDEGGKTMLTERDRKIKEGLERRKQILDAMKHWQKEYHESCAIAYGAINDGFYLLSTIEKLRGELDRLLDERK